MSDHLKKTDLYKHIEQQVGSIRKYHNATTIEN